MPDTFAITIIFIVLSAGIAAFFRGRSRDKCLKDFSSCVVTGEKTSAKTISGRLKVENTGLRKVCQYAEPVECEVLLHDGSYAFTVEFNIPGTDTVAFTKPMSKSV